jgi:hypothetical protein
MPKGVILADCSRGVNEHVLPLLIDGGHRDSYGGAMLASSAPAIPADNEMMIPEGTSLEVHVPWAS